MALNSITNLYHSRPSLAMGNARGMLADARWVDLLDVSAKVAFGNKITVTSARARVRANHVLVVDLGLEVIDITLDVKAPLNLDLEVQFAFGMIGENGYWDRMSCD